MKRILQIGLLSVMMTLIMQALKIDESEILLSRQAKQMGDHTELGTLTETFHPQDKAIHALAHLEEILPSQKIEVRWIAIDAISQPNYLIARQSFTLDPQNPYLHVFLERGPNPWPAGHYEIRFLLHGNQIASKRFRILPSEPEKINTSPNATNGNPVQRFPIYLARSYTRDVKGNIHPEGVAQRFPTIQHQLFGLIPYRNLKTGTPYYIEWWEKGAKGSKLLYRQEGKIETESGVLIPSLERDDDWVPGEYEIRLYLQNKAAGNASFQIIEPSTTEGDPAPQKGSLPSSVGKGIDSILFTKTVVDNGGNEPQPGEVANQFRPDEPFYMLIKYHGMHPEDHLTVRWYKIDSTGKTLLFEEKGGRFDRAAGTALSKIELEGTPWPLGNYRVELLVNGVPVGTGDFEIVPSTQP